MSFRALSRGLALVLIFGTASLLMAQSQGQRPVVQQVTNSITAQPTGAPPKDRLKDLEDELSKALESFSPKGMLDAKPEPQYQPLPMPVIPNRRLREEQEKRKNWMLMEPDDLLQGNSIPDWFNPSAIKNEKKKTDLDLFYERLNQQRSLLNQKVHLNPDDLAPLSTSGVSDEPKSDNDEKLPDAVKGPASKLRDLLGGGSASVTAPRNGLSELFGINQNKLSREQIQDQVQAHKNLMDQYRQVLAGSTPAVTPVNSATIPGNSRAPSLPSGLPNSTLSTLPTTPGMVGSIYNPAIIPDHNATVLNQWNPLYAPPKLEPPKPAPIIEPPIEAPRRKF